MEHCELPLDTRGKELDPFCIQLSGNLSKLSSHDKHLIFSGGE
jgi:hypothetical protein